MQVNRTALRECITLPRLKHKRLLVYLWGTIILLRDKYCLLCGRVAVHPHHIFSRRHGNTLLDVRNGVGLCAGCHSYKVHTSPELYRDKLISYIDTLYGTGTFETLKQRAMFIHKPDLNAEELYLVNELKRLVPGFPISEWSGWSYTRKMNELRELRMARIP